MGPNEGLRIACCSYVLVVTEAYGCPGYGETSLAIGNETVLWFELLVESDIVAESKLEKLKDEADQLLRIIVTAVKKTKAANRE